jgi:hypothetical protein
MKKKRNTAPRDRTLRARQRVLKEARLKGYITNQRARTVGRFDQAWYHLTAMVRAGQLRHAGFNIWIPV